MADDKYLGKINGIITATELNSLLGLTVGTNIITGDITWLWFLTKDEKTLLIADRNIKHSISYDQLASAGIVKHFASGYFPEQQGKIITIGDKQYKCRLLTGGNANPASTSTNSEWDRFIVRFVPDNADSNWAGLYSIMQEAHSGNASTRIVRGNSNISFITNYLSTGAYSHSGFRPVLEFNLNVKYLIKSQDKLYTVIDNQLTDTLIQNVPTVQNFIDNGISNILDVSIDKLNKLPKPYSILTWIDSNDFSKASLNYTYTEPIPKFVEITTDPFSPLEKLQQDGDFEILTYSDQHQILNKQAQGIEEPIDEGKMFRTTIDDLINITTIDGTV